MILVLKNWTLAVWVALVSFTIGTLLFCSTFIVPNEFVIYIVGFYYVCIALVVNILVFFWVVSKWLYYPENALQWKQELLVLILNIPIALLYFSILFYLN